MKKIAVLGAGMYNTGVYKKLRQAGYFTYAIDGNANAGAAEYADTFVHLNFSDKELLLKFVSENQVDGIMPLNDWGTVAAAYVSSKLGLKGIDEESAICATDKGRMRDRWKKDNLPVPDYFVFSTLQEAKEGIEKIGFPCILKPTDAGGSGRGISVIKGMDELEWAYNFALPYVRNDRLICEKFVTGTELTIESISIEGEVYILAMSDKEKPELRTRVATSLNYSAAISDEQRKYVEEVVTKSVLSLGIHTGMAHTEVILDGMDLILVETGARGGGGHIFHTIIEAVSTINAPVVYADLLCGKMLEIKNIEKRGAVYRFFNPPHGILEQINNLEEVRNWDGVLDIGMVKRIGEEVGDLKNSMERAGHVITSGKSRKEAVALADKAQRRVEFIVEPIVS